MDIITDVLLAIRYYNDNHTNFSMTVVMILLSGQLFMWWCTFSPQTSFYQFEDQNKEFVFHSRDLKGDHELDEEKDDSFWYCTQSKDIRYKQRSDTTLYRLQGLIFVGKIGSGIMLWIQTIYLHNYEKEIHKCCNRGKCQSNNTCGNFFSIYHASLIATTISYSYNLWLSNDFQTFIETGTFLHWFYCDIFKYFSLFEIFFYKNIILPSNDLSYLLLVFFVLICMLTELVLYTFKFLYFLIIIIQKKFC